VPVLLGEKYKKYWGGDLKLTPMFLMLGKGIARALKSDN